MECSGVGRMKIAGVGVGEVGWEGRDGSGLVNKAWAGLDCRESAAQKGCSTDEERKPHYITCPRSLPY